MALSQTLGKGQGHLKAGFLGFQGSGKTMTATLLAIGTRRHFKLAGAEVQSSLAAARDARLAEMAGAA